MPSGILKRLRRILPLANKIADEIICEETDILEKTIPRMFEVMHRVAKFSCDYVRNCRRPFMGLTRANDSITGGPAYWEKIEEMDMELTEVIEDLVRAVDVEALRLAKETGKHLSQCANICSQLFLVEQQSLLERLKPVMAGYDLDRCCMEGTRQSILSWIMAWVADPQERNDTPHSNTYWLYGSPGIGKTSLAHSICATLHDRKHLAGAFFCRRDDPHLSETRNILPTLIYKLA